MSHRFAMLSISVLLGLPGCIEFPELPDAQAGMETSPCIESQCFGELSCVDGVCLDQGGTDTPPSENDDEDDGDDDTESPGTGGGTDSRPEPGSSTTGEPGPGTSDSTASDSTASASETGNDTRGTDSGSDTIGFIDSDTSDSSDTGVGFIDDSDSNGVDIECSIWEQDCPVGEKCMPWANDGGSTWNATRCAPVDPFPSSVGQPCTVEGSGVSGIDDCEEGALCWDVEPETNEGVCVAQCQGSEFNPQCGTGTTCVIANQNVLALCLPSCDPLVQGCPSGEGCYPIAESFVCAPDSSGADGQAGDACVNINVCAPGLACISAALVPGCSTQGCCSAYCDLAASNTCAGTGDCIAWYEQGQAPPGFEDVGVCGVV